MAALVQQHTATDAHHFVNRIPELEAAILDMHARRAMRAVAAIDIRDAARRISIAPFHAMNPCAEPTPSDLILRCRAERSMPMKAAVRETLPSKRLICAMR